MNVFYVSIRTTENYEFVKIRIPGVTGTPLIIKTARATILYAQPEIKFCSPSGHFQPLAATALSVTNFFILSIVN